MKGYIDFHLKKVNKYKLVLKYVILFIESQYIEEG